jgi:hypothetical protein
MEVPLSGSAGYTAGVTFGSGITYAPGATTFVLQPGIYLVQVTLPEVLMTIIGAGGQTSLGVPVLVNGSLVDNSIFGAAQLSNGQAAFSVTGNKLLQISAANTVLGFNVLFQTGLNPSVNVFTCRINFTRLQ